MRLSASFRPTSANFGTARTNISRRRSSKRRAVGPTTTFGEIAIPPQFVAHVGQGLRGRVYVSISRRIRSYCPWIL